MRNVRDILEGELQSPEGKWFVIDCKDAKFGHWAKLRGIFMCT
jgi:hypothetical protein